MIILELIAVQIYRRKNKPVVSSNRYKYPTRRTVALLFA